MTELLKKSHHSSDTQEQELHQSVIQCPSCQTKFAIESDLLNEHEFPRFHCSRCDHVFAVDEAGKASMLPQEKSYEEMGKALNVETSIVEEDDFALPATPSSVTTTYSSYASVAPSRGLEIPRVTSSNLKPSPPHESPSNSPYNIVENPDGQMEINFVANSIQGNTRNSVTTYEAFKAHLEQKQSALTKQKASNESKNAPATNEPSLFEWGDEARGLEAQGLSPSQKFFKSNRSGQTSQRTGFSPHVTLLIGAIPVILVTAALGFLSVVNPNIFSSDSKITALLTSQAEKVAPAGLYMKDLRLKSTPLETGEDIYVISGKLINASGEAFEDVQLEGIAFNNAGDTIGDAKASAGSALAKTRLESLSLEMIKKLQSQPAPRRYALKPGDAQDFTLALPRNATNKKAASAKFFTARVYSVKN